MLRLWGRRPAACEPLLLAWCEASTEACALVDGAGAVLGRSAPFAALERLEEAIPARLRALSASLEPGADRLDDDGWLAFEATRLPGTDAALVKAKGPGVIRARLSAAGGRRLSRRESECLSIALEGAENRAVAAQLGLQPETVKVHLRNAYRKLEAAGRAELLARLVEPR